MPKSDEAITAYVNMWHHIWACDVLSSMRHPVPRWVNIKDEEKALAIIREEAPFPEQRIREIIASSPLTTKELLARTKRDQPNPAYITWAHDWVSNELDEEIMYACRERRMQFGSMNPVFEQLFDSGAAKKIAY